MTRSEQKPVATNVRPENPSQPSQTAPNSAQSVEGENKSTGTQNPVDQQRGLEPNVQGNHPQSKPVPGQPAAQHATGSFTGKEKKTG